MTDTQFETFLSYLTDIKNSIESLKGKPTDKHLYDLSDIYNELDSITRAVGDVETAANNTTSAVEKIELS